MELEVEDKMANEELKTRIIEKVEGELVGVIRENLDGILSAYEAFLLDHGDGVKTTYNVPCAVMLSPCGRGVRVRAKVSYGVKHTDETEGAIADTEPEFDFKRK